jgi:hypothetical protein
VGRISNAGFYSSAGCRSKVVASLLRELRYRLLVRLAGVARGFAFAVLRTVIVPSRAIAGVEDASGYFLVEGQMRRQG